MFNLILKLIWWGYRAFRGVRLNTTEENVLDQLLKTSKIREGRKLKCVVATVGVCGSGKTTIARSLSATLGLHYVSADDIRVMLRQQGGGYDHVGEILMRFVLDRWAQNEGSVVDSDFGSWWKRLLLRASIASTFDCPVFFVRTVCDLDHMIGCAIMNAGDDEFFAKAKTSWPHDHKGAVVKVREMVRQLPPNHYRWRGGRWILQNMRGIFATIDTTDDFETKLYETWKRIESQVLTGSSAQEDCLTSKLEK